MCSSWYNNWVTQQHARCNNENSYGQFAIEYSACLHTDIKFNSILCYAVQYAIFYHVACVPEYTASILGWLVCDEFERNWNLAVVV